MCKSYKKTSALLAFYQKLYRRHVLTMLRNFLLFCQVLFVLTENDGSSGTHKSFSIKVEDIKREPIMTLNDKDFEIITRYYICTGNGLDKSIEIPIFLNPQKEGNMKVTNILSGKATPS